MHTHTQNRETRNFRMSDQEKKREEKIMNQLDACNFKPLYGIFRLRFQLQFQRAFRFDKNLHKKSKCNFYLYCTTSQAHVPTHVHVFFFFCQLILIDFILYQQQFDFKYFIADHNSCV